MVVFQFPQYNYYILRKLKTNFNFFSQVEKVITTNLTAAAIAAAAAVSKIRARESHPDLAEVGTSFGPVPTQLSSRLPVRLDQVRVQVRALDPAQNVITDRQRQQQRQLQLQVLAQPHPPSRQLRLQSWEDLFPVSFYTPDNDCPPPPSLQPFDV